MKTLQQIGQLEMGCLTKRVVFFRETGFLYTWMSSLVFWWMYIAPILKPCLGVSDGTQHEEVAVTLVHGEKEAVTYTKRNVNSEQRLHIL